MVAHVCTALACRRDYKLIKLQDIWWQQRAFDRWDLGVAKSDLGVGKADLGVSGKDLDKRQRDEQDEELSSPSLCARAETRVAKQFPCKAICKCPVSIALSCQQTV